MGITRRQFFCSQPPRTWWIFWKIETWCTSLSGCGHEDFKSLVTADIRPVASQVARFDERQIGRSRYPNQDPLFLQFCSLILSGACVPTSWEIEFRTKPLDYHTHLGKITCRLRASSKRKGRSIKSMLQVAGKLSAWHQERVTSCLKTLGAEHQECVASCFKTFKRLASNASRTLVIEANWTLLAHPASLHPTPTLRYRRLKQHQKHNGVLRQVVRLFFCKQAVKITSCYTNQLLPQLAFTLTPISCHTN